MNVKEENICRLCLNVVENDFQKIDEVTRKMFKVLSLKVNLDISEDPIICKDCAEIVEKCFHFKSACIDNEKLIYASATGKKRATFEWKDVYKDEKDIKTIDDNFVCRFCNLSTGCNFIMLDTLMGDVRFAEMLQQLMPETDFDIIENPIICTACNQDLECYAKFVETCLDVEEKITKYLQSECAPTYVHVKLGEILRFTSKNISELKHTIKHEIKQELILEETDEAHSGGYDNELIKTEEMVIKDEEVNFDEIACETPPDLSLYKLNVPCGSTSRIRYTRISLKQNSSSTPTMADYRKCTCGTRQHCIKCNNMKSNMVSEIGMGKAYQKSDKGEVDKKIDRILMTENIPEEQVFKCIMCPFETTHKSTLKCHISLAHKDISKVETYKCSMCAYKTKYQGHLKRHMLSHKDNAEMEMFRCSICTYQTKKKGNLKNHMLSHKTAGEVQMYRCLICTFETKYAGSLEKHVLIHKDVTEVELYKCGMCTFETRRKTDLKRHVLSHTYVAEVEKYKCSICTYETKNTSCLKAHMLSHKDIEEAGMYKCSMCTYETKRKRNFMSHMLVHKSSGVSKHQPWKEIKIIKKPFFIQTSGKFLHNKI